MLFERNYKDKEKICEILNRDHSKIYHIIHYKIQIFVSEAEEMSCPSNYLMQFPNETLLMIFNHLDGSSLYVAGNVCKRWSDIVQILHDESWRSLTKAVMLKAEIIGPKYKSIGWVEQEHRWNTCNCINIAKKLVPYEDIELLINDKYILERPLYPGYSISCWGWKKSSDGQTELEISMLEQAEAASRQAAAGIITSLDNLTFHEFYEDLSSVKNISHLVRIVKNMIYLTNVICKDFAILSRNMFCKKLEIYSKSSMIEQESRIMFTDEDIICLTEVLNDRVEEFQFGFDSHIKFPYIKNYDGRGKCHEINFEYYDEDDEEFESDLQNVHEWASSKGWTVEVIYDSPDTNFAPIDGSNPILMNLTRN